ncbi:uncharacterized protein LOC128165574 [Crassostrea angulata]|uniref:uncharacterized protein LOC128165574 n=1 Tax=Magallana angulata TaxID=2784310 RepID=UPI0022B17EE4|nr:uncharacterized protein LOC128165574 [Crassostrea angulata]
MDKFISNVDCQKWLNVYRLYGTGFKMKMAKMKSEKGKELKVLDSWFQNELPAAIQERNEKYVTKMELCELMKWKLSKGKFRPRLQQMVESNSEDLIISASKKAFKHLPNLKKAIEELTVLKAVGPATASAVLTAGAPDQAAFMADESMQALPGLMPLQYTLGFYLQYMDQIKQILKILQKEDKTWTAHQVELTLWTFQFLKLNDPPLLIEAMEGSSKRKQENSNGDAKSNKKLKSYILCALIVSVKSILKLK